MNKLIFLLLCILFFSCGNNSKSGSTISDLLPKKSIVVKDKLDSVLVEEVLNLIESNFHLDFPDIPLDESFIEISFMTDTNAPINSSDSIVRVSYNIFGSYDNAQKYYKGMLDIYGYNVAIFDLSANSFGYKFFNADSLKQIPLESFKPYPTEIVDGVDVIVCANRYFVSDGKIVSTSYKGK